MKLITQILLILKKIWDSRVKMSWGLFEALKFMKLMGVMAKKIWESPLSGSGWEWHSHDGWSSQIATVPSKFATGAVCNAAQCWGSSGGGGRGINGTISVSGTETGWRGRQSFNPARNDTKWLPLAALPRESSDRVGSARLIYTRNATKPLLFCSQICHFMRLALQNWGGTKNFLSIFIHFLSLQSWEKGSKTERRILDVSAYLELTWMGDFLAGPGGR